MRYKPAPDGFTNEEWWVATKFARRSVQHPLPFKDKQGTPFWFSEHANMYRQLHEIDQNAGGHIEVLVRADLSETDQGEAFGANGMCQGLVEGGDRQVGSHGEFKIGSIVGGEPVPASECDERPVVGVLADPNWQTA